MNSTAQHYDAASSALTAVLDSVPAGSWDRPTPCEGWSAADVVEHMVTTQRQFLTEHALGLGPAPLVAPDPSATWREHAAQVVAVLADDAVPATGFDGYFGPTTLGASFEQFYVWDMLVHRWDVARATGTDAGLTEADLDRIEAGADSFGPALYLDGVCQPAVPVPPGAGRQVRLLARLGRRSDRASAVTGR